jgi:hypothetical protein
MLIKTSISAEYQRNLTVLWCLRELGANGIDGEERNKQSGAGCFEWSHSKRSGTVEFINWGVKVSTAALLMGTSESRSEEKCIGQFGEGLPLALKQLCYLGHDVEIYNRDEKWTPKLEAQKEFDGKRVLTVSVRTVKDRGGFIVRVKNIERSLWLKLQALFLKTHPSYDSQETASGLYTEERVLLQPEFKGKVYNKGVFLLEREDLLFGYLLQAKDDEIGRDRQLMSDSTLVDRTGGVLNEAVRHDTDFQETLMEALFCGSDELELKDWYSSLQYRTEFRGKCVTRFYDWYGQNALPVADDSERKQAEMVGLDGIILPRTLRSILSLDIECLADRLACHNTSVQQEIDPSEVQISGDSGIAACHLLAKVKDLVSYATKEPFTLKVVTFGGEELRSRLDTEANEVQIAKWVVEGGFIPTLKAVATSLAPREGLTPTDLLCVLLKNFSEGF